MKRSLLLPLFLLAGACIAPPSVCADALIVTRAMTASTIAEIYVMTDTVRVELEIGAADLRPFRNVMPDGLYEKLADEPLTPSRRYARFLERDWVVRTDDKRLEGTIARVVPRLRVERDDVTGEPLPAGGDEGEPVVFVEVVYPLVIQPRTMSIRPPMREGADVAAANVGFVLYHRGLPVTDFRYLGAEETLDLDWEDPWFSRFRNRNLKRQFDAPLSAFLYVEPFEVRKEIIARPKDLQQWVDLGLDGREVIPVEAQAEVKRRVAEFLMSQSPVTIDGRTPEPVLDRIHFVRRSLRRTGVIDPPEDLPAVSATLGVIFVYPIDSLPQHVSMPWSLFSDKIRRVPSVATDEAGGLPYALAPGDSILAWQNFLTRPTIPTLVDISAPGGVRRIPLPVVSVAGALALGFIVVRYRRTRPRRWWMLGASVALATAVLGLPHMRITVPLPLPGAGVSDADARTIVSGLLTNVYRAFDYRDEGVIYDALARSTSGELLTEVYLETRRALELQNQGGARVKVKDVSLQSIVREDLRGEAGFSARCTWNVSGSVGHWGHVHTRTNGYDAVLTVKPVGRMWKITGLELLDEQRISREQTTRRGYSGS